MAKNKDETTTTTKKETIDKFLNRVNTLKYSSSFTDSQIHKNKYEVSTPLPMLNAILSGKLDGGFGAGVHALAAPSAHFKSNIALIMVGSFLKQFEDSRVIFYDSEFGITEDYLIKMNIDPDRVIHKPIKSVENLTNDITILLDEYEKGEVDTKIIILIDSIGNLRTDKEHRDRLEEKDTQDMTKEKKMKAMFGSVMPRLVINNIPMIVISHTYDTIGLFSKTEVTGGNGLKYNANNIYTISKNTVKDKETKEIEETNFVMKVYKSRFVKESKTVTLQCESGKGVDKLSGILDYAIKANMITKHHGGWYQLTDPITGELLDKKYRESEIMTLEFFRPIVTDPYFKKFIESEFKLSIDIDRISDDNEKSRYSMSSWIFP